MGAEGKPLCSVGIPTYNRPALLAATLQEIRTQTYPNLEIIISDNASPDADVEKTCRQAAAVDRRIWYIRQEENIGPSANFEFVFRQATGQYFMWAADDDRRSLTYIEKLVAALQARPAAVLCAMEACYETSDGIGDAFPQYSAIYSGLGGDKKDRILKNDRPFRNGQHHLRSFSARCTAAPRCASGSMDRQNSQRTSAVRVGGRQGRGGLSTGSWPLETHDACYGRIRPMARLWRVLPERTQSSTL